MKRKNIFIVVIAAAVCLIAVGILQGQPIPVMEKAIRICLECIGIG